MPSLWALDLTEEPTTDRYPAIWPGDDAGGPYPESVRRGLRERREPEDDPRTEFVGAYLDREV
jgi:hypothetical protein